MTLPDAPVYLPFEPGPYRMTMGLVARDPDDMIVIDNQYHEEMALRRDLLATNGAEVFAGVPGYETAGAEVLAMLVELLPRRFPAWFTRSGSILHNRLTDERWDLQASTMPPLELAGRLVQEDLCIVRPAESGPVLEAAVLCFPARWRLLDKLGLPLAAVHAHVPIYGDRLARPVDRFMATLRAGKLAERLNWSLNDDPALFQQKGKGRVAFDSAITADNAGDRLFLRVERQTLRSLPESARVLFTIRTYVYPLKLIASDPAVAERLAEAVEALPPEMQRYKSIPPYKAALREYLTRR